MATDFGFNIIVNYNPGNAISGLNQLTTGLLQARTAGVTFAQSFSAFGGGFTNFESQVGGAGGAIQLYKSEATSIVPVNTQAANSINRLVTTFTSAGQAIAGSARLMAPFKADVAEIGVIAQTTGAKFSAGLAPAVAAVGGPLNNLNAQLGTSSSGLTNLGNSATQSATGLGRLREIFSGNRGLVFGMSALFGTITGIVFEFQLMSDASKQVSDSQAVVNGLIAQGKQGTAQYQQALQALGKDQRFLEFSTRNMALAFTNLIPDVLLITNGFIQLSAKFQTTGTAAQTFSTGMTGVQTAMKATTLATTELGVAQTVLGNGLTTSGNSFKAVVPILTQAGQGMIGIGTAGTAAVGGLTSLNTATGGLRTGLAATVTSAGTAITQMGAIGLAARTSATPLGTLGVAGRTAATDLELVSAAGIGSRAALLGAVAGPVALGAAFLAMGLILKNLSQIFAEVKASQVPMIAIEDEATVAVYKLGAAHETAAQQAETAITNLATNLTSKYESMVAGAQGFASDIVTALTPGEPNALKPSDIKKPDIGPTQAPGAGTSTATPSPDNDIAGRISANIQNYLGGIGNLSKPNTVGTGPPAPADKGRFIGPLQPGAPTPKPLTDLEILEQQRLRSTKGASDLLTQESKPGGLFENFPKNQKLDLPTYEKAVDIVDKLQDKEGKLSAMDKTKYLRELNQIITGTVAETGAKKAATDAEKEFDKAATEAEKAFVAQNADIGKMPQALQNVLGLHQQFTKQVEIGGKMVTLEDKALQAHVALIDQEAAGYTSSNAILGQSLKVKEELVNIGTKVVGGVEEELNHVTALNLFWGQMNGTIKDSILTNQQLTISAIDVTASLTNQAQHQFLVNEGMIAGKEAAQSFIENQIAGAAQTKQYNASLLEIVDTLGIKLPDGMKLTNDQAELVIQSFEQTGSAAGALAAIINDRIAPAVQRLGDVLTAKSWKEFKDAFKGLEFGDTPDKLVKKFQDFDNMVRKINEDGREMQTVFDQMDIMQSLGKLDVKTFSQGLDAMSKQVEHIGKLQGIDVSNITDFIDRVKAMKDPSALVKFHDVFALISADAQNGYTSQELQDIANAIKGIDPTPFNKLSAGMKATVSSLQDIDKLSDAAKVMLGIKQPEGTTTWDPKQQKFVNTPNTPETPQGPEQKFATAVDKFATAVSSFTAAKTPITPTPPTAGASVTAGAKVSATTGASATDAFKGGTALQPLVTQSAEISKQVQTIFSSMYVAVTGIVTGMGRSITTALASSQTAFANFSNQGSNSMALLIGHIKAHITTIGTYFAKTIPTDVSVSTLAFQTMGTLSSQSMARFIATLKAHITTIGTYFTKTIPVDVSVSAVAFQTMSVLSSQAMARLITTIKSHITTITTYFTKTIPTDLSVTWLAFQTLNQLSSQSMAKLIAVLKAHITTIGTYFTKTVPADLQTAADAFNQFMVDSSNSMAKLIANLKPHMTTLGTYFTKTIPDDMKTATSAVKAFESAFTSSMQKVTSAANSATSAVNALVAAVKKADGAKATVTVTTEFKTSGSPPSGGSKAGSSAHGLLANVISAASPKSFAEGGIQTVQGPQLAFFGDNPGGIETHAFIPHDNPFPILKKLAKMFSKNSRAGEIVDSALGRAEEMWIDLHLQIDNIMDGEKVSRQIVRKTFKKMRTRP